ncbi:MAG: hypothetical protein EOO65_04160 [Methanosarcinales archaeon]|nr:MAG: hypothetical protein EOO65_04160 [Methanosarcinales archaeon]
MLARSSATLLIPLLPRVVMRPQHSAVLSVRMMCPSASATAAAPFSSATPPQRKGAALKAANATPASATVPSKLVARLRGEGRRESFATTRDKGQHLEGLVVRLLRAEGRSHVKQNVFLKDKHGNRSEIDVTCGWGPFKRYYECKNYAASMPVPLEDVAKFKQVLQLNGIPLRKGVFVTLGRYSPRATTVGIRTMDGDELRRWAARVKGAQRRRRLWRALTCLSLLAGSSLVTAELWAPAAVQAGWITPAKQQQLYGVSSVLRVAAVSGWNQVCAWYSQLTH